ncbi:SPOR domain-containing protein [Chitiniphilus eburneus]|uniref:SPOR domain-containing protein n=1 Tax=Chitiniphilus eburneus TaxID=2571148 RepID=A0A4U0Q564_9NEIS|nr:SPOR domain-containing protein [Chitiniphilus eburneus]TJZ76297.1 hypothetical protein FAZ21_05845 [Chitiniphilus eburneus]
MSDGQDPLLREAEQHRLKEQVFWRLGIATGLIVIILAGIYLLDRPDSTPQLAPTPAQPRIAAIPAPKPVVASAPVVTASAPLAENASIASDTATAPSPTAAAPVAAPAAPATTPTPSPVVAVRPLGPTLNETDRPALPGVVRPAQPQIARPTPPDIVRPVSPTLARPAPVEPPARPVVATEPATYTVQAGVFLHANNAEKLLRQLQNAGIPAYLETRVQIGPFKTKAEAEAAKRQLRALGIDPVLHNN